VKTSLAADDRGSVQGRYLGRGDFAELHSRGEHVDMQTFPSYANTGMRLTIECGDDKAHRLGSVFGELHELCRT
jgi:hypothetical protein